MSLAAITALTIQLYVLWMQKEYTIFLCAEGAKKTFTQAKDRKELLSG